MTPAADGSCGGKSENPALGVTRSSSTGRLKPKSNVSWVIEIAKRTRELRLACHQTAVEPSIVGLVPDAKRQSSTHDLYVPRAVCYAVRIQTAPRPYPCGDAHSNAD